MPLIIKIVEYSKIIRLKKSNQISNIDCNNQKFNLGVVKTKSIYFKDVRSAHNLDSKPISKQIILTLTLIIILGKATKILTILQ